ncbi:MAG TPA: hypothetical protein GX528_07105, partial [Firmicutes bacterium]|nr:hypothetical protein [Bacillota bacterium]
MKRLELLIAIIILCGLSLPVQAKVVLVLWHGLQWEQLAGLNVEGPVAFGLLNTRAGGGSAPGAGYLSIGAGARAVGTSQAAAFLTQEEPGPYELNTGLKKGPIALPYIAPLLAAQNVSYTVKPGALGSALKQAGRSSLVLGCSDTQEKVRWAPLIAMDPTGRAPFGSVGQEILLADAGYPYGVRTNYELVAELVFAAAADLIVVDMGDPYRLDQYSQFLLPAQQKTLSRRMAAEGRDFLEQLAAGLPEAAVIFLLSAYPAKEKAQEGLWLTPFLAIGWEGGLLSSSCPNSTAP